MCYGEALASVFRRVARPLRVCYGEALASVFRRVAKPLRVCYGEALASVFRRVAKPLRVCYASDLVSTCEPFFKYIMGKSKLFKLFSKSFVNARKMSYGDTPWR